MKKIGLLAMGIAGLLLSGCGDEAKPATNNNAGTPAPSSAAPAAPAAEGNTGGPKVPFPADKAKSEVTGTVTFDGDAPKPKMIQIQGDNYCVDQHKDAPAMRQDLEVNADNKGIQDAFVYVKTTPAAWSYEVPSAPVVVEQHGCIYVPHMIGVMAKQAVHVDSKDGTTHNVHFISKTGVNDSKNQTETEGQSIPFMFNHPEMGSFFKCDIHSWMQCQVEVMDNPFFAVTDKDGKYKLPMLPAGDYEIAVWHEKLGESTQKAKLEDGKPATVDFKLGKK